jgi:hypothetical protein
VGIRLERGDEPVQPQSHDPATDPRQPAMLADPLPYQPGTADLGHRGEKEEQQGSHDSHVGDSTHPAVDRWTAGMKRGPWSG